MPKYTTKQLVDLIRKGDPLSHKMLRVIADRLENSQREHAHRLDEVRELQEGILWFLECWEMIEGLTAERDHYRRATADLIRRLCGESEDLRVAKREILELRKKNLQILMCSGMKPPQDVGAYKEAEQTLIASVDALADKVEGRSALVLDAEHDVDTFVENIFRPALVITLKAENHRLRRGLEEIVSTAESDPENQHAMNSYSAGYSGGLEEQAQRAREVLLEKDSHTQPNY